MSSVLVVVDNHLVQTPNGQVWSKGIYDYSFFSRYLSAFDEVFVAIRISKIDEKHTGFTNLCSGPNVTFLPLVDFSGIKGYIKCFLKANRQFNDYAKKCDCAIVRLPSAIGYQFVRRLDGKKPYALEVVVDPWDFAAPGMLKIKFQSIIRHTWTRQLRKFCMKANGVSYVTQFALQSRYPSRAFKLGESNEYFESYYSSANIPTDFFMEAKTYEEEQKSFRLIHVANSINSYVKGHKEAIDVVQILNKNGFDVSIDFVGDGEYIDEFKNYAASKNIQNKVFFKGRISDREEMRKALRNADLFVFPTHGEGLPRVLLEAMAVGTPCVATKVNGIPELLPDDQMANVGDVIALAEIVENMLRNPQRLNVCSQAGVEKAKQFSEDKLQLRRAKFYKKLSDLCH